MVRPVLQGKRWSADAGQFALMYPSSRESGAFGAKAMCQYRDPTLTEGGRMPGKEPGSVTDFL